jgi:hypothetical protein
MDPASNRVLATETVGSGRVGPLILTTSTPNWEMCVRLLPVDYILHNNHYSLLRGQRNEK